MDCEWKSIRFYGFSMDSNDQTGSIEVKKIRRFEDMVLSKSLRSVFLNTTDVASRFLRTKNLKTSGS
jgi:hypothetical protein